MAAARCLQHRLDRRATPTAGEPTATTSAEADAFPVTIEHAFGETTIEEEPTRVATLGWTDQDHALALGVVPVGATKITWGGNAAGSSDWFDAALEEAGAEAPVRYDDSDGAPIDEVAQLEPDLILATNSGITEAEYAKLSKIAPVVAYPEFPWTTPWQTSLEMVGEALGSQRPRRRGRGRDRRPRSTRPRRTTPSSTGASLIYGYLTPADLSTVGIYAPQDPRVALLRDFGMVDADAVAGAIKEGEFYGTVSAERASELDSDVLLTWVEKPGDAQTFVDDKLLGQIPAIESGHFYAESSKAVAMAVDQPDAAVDPGHHRHLPPEGRRGGHRLVTSHARPRARGGGRPRRPGLRAGSARRPWPPSSWVRSRSRACCRWWSGARSIPLAAIWDGSHPLHNISQARVERTLLGLAVGAALALAGAVLQGLTRNPLADPGILGINAGASFAMVVGLSVFGVSELRDFLWVAFLGAAVAAVLVHVIASLGRDGATPMKLAIAGAALTAAATSWTTGVLLVDRQTMETFRYWQVGTIGGRDLDVLLTGAPVPAGRGASSR